MSELYGFSASDLNAFLASVLRARGLGGEEFSDSFRITLLGLTIRVDASGGTGIATVTALSETSASTFFFTQQGLERSLSGGLQYLHTNGDGVARGGLIIGLIDTAGFSDIDFTDTFSVHAGWAVNTRVVNDTSIWQRAVSSWVNPGYPYSTYATSSNTAGTNVTTRGIVMAFGTHSNTTQAAYNIRGLELRTLAPLAGATGPGSTFCLGKFGSDLSIPNGMTSGTSLTKSIATVRWDIELEANV